MNDREHMGQDMLSHLLRETTGDSQSAVSTPEIANSLYGFLFGASDNVSSSMASIIFHLADLPDVYDQVLKGTHERTITPNLKSHFITKKLFVLQTKL